MKKAGLLTVFLMAAFITQADLVDDFEGYSTGPVSDVASPPWTVETTGLSDIGEDAGNRFIGFAGDGDWRYFNRETGLPVASLATLYFRVYVTSETLDHAFGLTEFTGTAADWYADYGAYVRITDDTAGVAGVASVDVRNGGSFVDDIAAVNLNQWYSIWLVIDPTEASGTFDVYVAEDGAAATAADLAYENAGFRNAYANPLGTFLLMAGTNVGQNVRVDDIHVVTGQDLSYMPFSIKPYDPLPQQALDPVNNDVDVLLTWKAGKDPAMIDAVNPAIVDEYIFWGTASDPNLYYLDATGQDPGTTDPGSSYGPINLAPGSLYYWAVVEAIDGYEQALTASDTLSSIDPNNIVGPVWSFTTDLLVPSFSTDPVDRYVFPGETAEFSAALKDDAGAAYQWYKDGSPVSNSPGKIEGAQSTMLTIYDAQAPDEGEYLLQASNDSGSTDSQTALLQLKTLRSYYPMETTGIGADGNSLTPDTVGGFDMILTSEDAGATGLPTLDAMVVSGLAGSTTSLLLDNGDHADDPNGMYGRIPAGVVDYPDITITAWVYWNGGANWQRLFDFGVDTSHYMFLTPNNGTEARFVLNNGGGEQIVAADPLVAGEWVFIAAVVGDDTGSLYVNGEPAGENTGVTINPADIAATVNYIGKSQYTADAEFDGWIDELKIYNYALDAESLAARYYDVTGVRACFDPDFAGSPYNLDNTGSSYCQVDLADFAVFAANWLADGLYSQD